jgi:outer membrane protein assembly factor BamB
MAKIRLISLGVVALVFLSLSFLTGCGPRIEGPGVIDESQWYMANGNAARNRIGEKGIRSTPELLWHFPSDRCITSHPVIYKGVVHLADWGGRVYAMDVMSGKEKWRFTNPEWPDQIWSSPAVDEKYVYSAHVDGLLWAINRETGDVGWEMRLEDGPSAAEDLTIYEGKLFFSMHTTGGENLVCVDLSKREMIWKKLIPKAKRSSYSAPTIDSGKVYAVTTQDVQILDAQNGDVLVKSAYTLMFSGGPAAVSEGRVYLLTTGNVECLNAESLETVWIFPELPFGAKGPPAVSSDSVFVASDGPNKRGAILFCIDKKNGTEKWRCSIKWDEEMDVVSCPIVGGDVVYFCVGDIEKGKLFAVDAKTGKELWNFETGPACHAGIALVGDIVVLTVGGAGGQNGNVYALKEKSANPQPESADRVRPIPSE